PGRARPARDAPPRAAVVEIRIPADPEYVPLLRAACGHLAPRLGCTLAEISDLRLAVDEACGLLLRNCITLSREEGQDCLTATFTVDEQALRVTVGMHADAFAMPHDDEFGWTILTALVEGFAWRVEGATVQVEILKTHAAGR
ncbi:MAG: anti-sigma regulatory factor, partial [Catenulispora sp.]|nr:anti-sigma regulatory factor [Catenulispora sp.]